ncbi:DgyrCDS7038 [Dimorphilus gyrociliatus]|uniref:DgyrCDS7038 n=1 Tax=Dimorphilus gyrociliatus TaxID=2664684 RepID=A0A7I8VQ16_9ANNE|nr:DgyrCDS7038 [Dimorphilus gyrociliatus]
MAAPRLVFDFSATTIPDFDSRCFNSKGNFHSWLVDNITIVCGTKKIFEPKKYQEEKTLNINSDKHILVVQSVKCHIDVSFYKKFQYGKYSGDVFIYNSAVYSRGQRSFVIRYELTHPSYNKPFFVGYSNHVLIDKATRKPAILTKNMIEWFDNERVPEQSTKIPRITPPENTFEDTSMVLSSQIDWYFHLNHSEYNKLCFDCAAKAVSKNFYRFFHSDICHYHIKDTFKLQLGECLMGDKLRIITWQDETKSEIIYFQIIRISSNQIVFEMTVIYYKESLSLGKL